jgi:hypothetical protein
MAFSIIGMSQANGVVVGGKWANQVAISDVNGRPFENIYNDVSGTPYFNASFKAATITLKRGAIFKDVLTRIDLVSQQVHFLSSDNIEGFIEIGNVKEVSYTDTSISGIQFYKFQSGFPLIDKQDQRNFYQVLAEGKCGLVKSITKSISERKNELSGEVAKEFETTENFYFFVKGELKRLKKDKDFVMAELADKPLPVNRFVLDNKINFKNIDQIVKLLNYYNTL